MFLRPQYFAQQKPSFISNKSTSLIDQPAKSNAFLEAGIGPVPIIEGSTPQLAHDFIETNFFIFLFQLSKLDISVTAAAPSFIPDAFPAVTVPSFLKTGFNLERDSKFTDFSWVFIYVKI